MRKDRSGIRESSEMLQAQRTIRTRFRLWGSNLEQDTTELLPAILWIVLGLYVGWFFVFLFFAIDNKPITDEGMQFYLIIFRGLVGGFVPILGAYGVGSDKTWTSWYIPFSFALLSVAALTRSLENSDVVGWEVYAAFGLFVIVSLLLFSPDVRRFYRNVKANAAELGH